MLANAALIEARDAEERLARLQLEQSLQDENTKRAAQISQPPPPALEHESPKPVSAEAVTANGDSSAVDGDIESWSPRALQRGEDRR